MQLQQLRMVANSFKTLRKLDKVEQIKLRFNFEIFEISLSKLNFQGKNINNSNIKTNNTGTIIGLPN